MYNRELAAQRRNELGLTQEQLAHKSGVSSQLISKYERGIHSPDRTNQDKLEKALDLPDGALWTKDSNKRRRSA
jgi:transcriptional regulator with XRE-family HTH domain